MNINKTLVLSIGVFAIVMSVLLGPLVVAVVRLSLHSFHLVLTVPIECVEARYNQPVYCPK